ncbi:UbiH/UbiF/VisC/COQ6 family ubiquinone biosynthesis hydroxylase [Ferruginivarius sediminum]|uniref:2-octaprenyl-6-methoxyphenyl hydroxylase n=1 Tax=Ferruginivarius sediminum TaxID=2661937 RepID=A0A369TD68_9PROT|nr:UbiH/UbiF/VisC/COQ6 family ubiquinone biosynthesis hydroxylase [Ferruginivarius sediminum]RDD63230.1 2-octaprenyl-6-methoxyphenyl hydroxylase [Ferruginivarius sediminum]
MTAQASHHSEECIDAEVVIVGGGLVGATLAGVLASSGIETVLIDREDPDAVLQAAFDGRASAIAAGSRHMLEAIGLWPEAAAAAQPILDIRVTDGRVGRGPSALSLHYDHREVGEPLGHIVANQEMRKAQHRFLPTLDRLLHLAPMTVDRVIRRPGGVEARLGDGRRVRARLCCACDGRGSRLRQDAGIRTTQWTYPQAGVVATLEHEKPHRGVAYEHFLPSGPFAMLPMVDEPPGTHRSSIVWTERRDLAQKAVKLSDRAFGQEVLRRFGTSLGDVRPVGPRFTYPLSGLHAERYIDRRLALVGDAAHGIHPIAGQGLNLGFRDVAALAECIVDARRLGQDIGTKDVLVRYQRWRRPDNLMLVAATDSLNRLFSNNFGPLRVARDLGLGAVNQIGPLKRLFMRHAMGTVGDLPRLIEGRPL